MFELLNGKTPATLRAKRVRKPSRKGQGLALPSADQESTFTPVATSRQNPTQENVNSSESRGFHSARSRGTPRSDESDSESDGASRPSQYATAQRHHSPSRENSSPSLEQRNQLLTSFTRNPVSRKRLRSPSRETAFDSFPKSKKYKVSEHTDADEIIYEPLVSRGQTQQQKSSMREATTAEPRGMQPISQTGSDVLTIRKSSLLNFLPASPYTSRFFTDGKPSKEIDAPRRQTSQNGETALKDNITFSLGGTQSDSFDKHAAGELSTNGTPNQNILQNKIGITLKPLQQASSLAREEQVKSGPGGTFTGQNPPSAVSVNLQSQVDDNVAEGPGTESGIIEADTRIPAIGQETGAHSKNLNSENAAIVQNTQDEIAEKAHARILPTHAGTETRDPATQSVPHELGHVAVTADFPSVTGDYLADRNGNGAVRHAYRPRQDYGPVTMAYLPEMSENDINRVLETYIEELRSDNEYWIHTCLRQAFDKLQNGASKCDEDPPTSVFKHLKPLAAVKSAEQPDKYTAKFRVENFYGSKSAKPTWVLPCEMIAPNEVDIPNYSHYVSLRRNVLSNNETTLLHWPYFSDDFHNKNYTNVKNVYFLDIEHRERKLVALLKAENMSRYIEDLLTDLGIAWSDVLHFLLDQEPDVGTSQRAIVSGNKREQFCQEDFMRNGKRWAGLASRLPPTTPAQTGRAAILCDIFQQKTDFPLWHLARRSRIVTDLLRPDDEDLTVDEVMCRVCMRYDCPHHGEVQESLDAKEPTNKTDFHVVETDIIQPLDVNERWRVGFPAPNDDRAAISGTREKRNLQYWQQHAYGTKVDERGPFYPCHHPGKTCSEKHCSCFVENIPCEKMCSCASDCARKYQGCSCSTEKLKKGQKMVCFEDERCSCFQLGRECDPDLCGDCGVCEVVDPTHKHNDQILIGRCRNASLQRGICKHTVLGESGIHGLGLYACENIREHEFVGEYRGEIITKDEAERRGAVYQHQKLSYLFTLNNTQEIDSTYFGNKIRFINHATDKHKACNLYPRIIMVNTVHRIALYGKRNIKPGEELFFDYGPQFPNEQLGGNSESKSRKSAPHVRNALLVKGFYPVEETTDVHGNVRARKMGYPSGSSNIAIKRAPKSRQRGGRTGMRGGRGSAAAQVRRANAQQRQDHDESSESDKSGVEDAATRSAAYHVAESYGRKRRLVQVETSEPSDDGDEEYDTAGQFQPSTESDEYE